MKELDLRDIHQIKAIKFLDWLESNTPEDWKRTSEYTRLADQLHVFIKYGMRISWSDEDEV